jgi:DNA-binding CsgD family transcriptional regulator
MTVPWAAAARAVADVCHTVSDSVSDPVSLRVRVLAEVARVVPHDAYAWVLTDPVTCVGVAPLASVPDLEDLPRLVRGKYLTDLNRWTTLPTDRPVTLLGATSGRPERSLWWREVLSRYGVGDVLSLVLRDAYGCWSFLDLWREARSPAPAGQADTSFRDDEVAFLGRLQPTLCRAVRDTVARTFAVTSALAADGGPVLLTLGDDLRLSAQTPQTDAYLRALLPPGDRPHPVPAAAYNVAAQLLAVEAGVDNHPPRGRVHLRNGLWLTLHAARLSGTGTIAVTLEPTTPTDRAELFAASHALTPRESELLRRLLGGDDTRHLARQMGLSAHTVQDHLKAVFAKTGTRSRPMLVARILGQ